MVDYRGRLHVARGLRRHHWFGSDLSPFHVHVPWALRFEQSAEVSKGVVYHGERRHVLVVCLPQSKFGAQVPAEHLAHLRSQLVRGLPGDIVPLAGILSWPSEK